MMPVFIGSFVQTARDWVAAKPDREPKTRTDMLNHLMSMRACPAALVTGRRAWAADAGR